MVHPLRLNRVFFIFLALFVACAVLRIAAPVTAAANPAQILTISPASTLINQRPGTTQTYNISVLNSGKAGYYVDASVEPYRVVGLDYNPVFNQLPGTTSPVSWVKLSKTRVSVPAHETVIIPYDLTIPANAAPGGYYAVTFTEDEPPTNSGVQARSRVGDILYIQVAGKVRTSGSAKAKSLPHITIANHLPISFDVSNTGGVHFVTTTKVSASNVLGRAVFSSSMQRIVLPQTVRQIDTTWQVPPLGLFHVTRSASVAGSTQQFSPQWVLVIQPWVVAIVILLIVLIVCTFWLRRRRQR